MASQTAVARTVSGAVTFTVPACTFSPGPISTGRDSPVRSPLSTVDAPATTTPSIGSLSPARTSSRSPIAIASMGTSATRPVTGSRRRARLGVSASRSSAEDDARRWCRYRPTSMPTPPQTIVAVRTRHKGDALTVPLAVLMWTVMGCAVIAVMVVLFLNQGPR